MEEALFEKLEPLPAKILMENDGTTSTMALKTKLNLKNIGRKLDQVHPKSSSTSVDQKASDQRGSCPMLPSCLLR
jgi:hypothetical protein